ncbi:MAG TPA: hypothetical protein VGE52_03550, partial [Pirellulales bacterium]
MNRAFMFGLAVLFAASTVSMFGDNTAEARHRRGKKGNDCCSAPAHSSCHASYEHAAYGSCHAVSACAPCQTGAVPCQTCVPDASAGYAAPQYDESMAPDAAPPA